MQVADACDLGFEDRYHHFLTTVSATPKTPTEGERIMAIEMATTEMLNEQHAMLVALCDKHGVHITKLKV